MVPRKLLHAGIAALTFIGLTAVRAEATSISFTYGPTNTNVFNFGAYAFELTFQQINGSFDVSVEAIENPSLAGRLPAGYVCVPIAGLSCVEFEVSAPGPGNTTWSGFYDIFITWFADTDPLFPNTPVDQSGLGRIRILHNLGSTTSNAFETDITIPGSYCLQCLPPGDAGIGGTDNNFQSFIVAQAPAIPEPATILLLGSGVGALWYRRRRGRTQA
jgi:hypothetical protein